MSKFISKFSAFCLLAGLAVYVSCAPVEDGTTTTVTDGTTTTTTITIFPGYATDASWSTNYACVWTNGVQVELANAYGDSYANCVVRDGSDCYAAGNAENASGNWQACYWKNGAINWFSTNVNGTGNSWCADLRVSGSGIYAGGQCLYGGYNIPCIWNGATQIALTNGTYGSVYGVALDGSDRYAAGYIYTGSNTACVWQNEVLEFLPKQPGSGFSEAYDIDVNGGVVYVCGVDYISPCSACVWTDGAEVLLTNSASSFSYGYGIDADGAGVLVTGYFYNASSRNQACYWLDGAFTALTNPAGVLYESEADIAIKDGSDVYAGGYYYDADNYCHPCYWKNGLFIALPNDLGVNGLVTRW